MQLSNPSVLSVHLKRLSYSEFQVKTDYYCLELLLLLRTQLLGIDQAYNKITMTIYIQKVAIYYHHQNSEASYEYRSKKWKKNQWNKKMIPWSVNFFSLHCEYCHFVGWSCVMALLSTHILLQETRTNTYILQEEFTLYKLYMNLVNPLSFREKSNYVSWWQLWKRKLWWLTECETVLQQESARLNKNEQDWTRSWKQEDK